MPRFNHHADKELVDRDAVRRDVLIEKIKTKTPAQIGTYIDDNVTDLASAKKVLKGLAVAVGFLARRL
jgi:hypothetical protein